MFGREMREMTARAMLTDLWRHESRAIVRLTGTVISSGAGVARWPNCRVKHLPPAAAVCSATNDLGTKTSLCCHEECPRCAMRSVQSANLCRRCSTAR